MTGKFVTEATLSEVLIQVCDNQEYKEEGKIERYVNKLDWQCNMEGFFSMGHDHCLASIHKRAKSLEKKMKKPADSQNPDNTEKSRKEMLFVVWTAGITKTIFGILNQIPDYKVENLPKGCNLVTLHAKLVFISKHFKGSSLKLPPFDGLDGSWVSWKEQTFSILSAVGLDQLCTSHPDSMEVDDKRMVEALNRHDYWVGSALRGVLVKSRVSSIMVPKEGPVLASKIWNKLVKHFECESAKTYKASAISSRVQTCRFKTVAELESGYHKHVRDCNYLVSTGQASEKQAAHYLINSFSGISSMGSMTADKIDEVHHFVRNKTLEIDAGGRFKARFESEPKESKSGTRKARRVSSNEQGSEAGDERPVPYEMYMKLTNAEKKYVKNHKEMPESAKRRFELIEAEGSDPDGNMPAEKVGGSITGGSKKQGSKVQPTSKAKGNKHKIKGRFQRKKKNTSSGGPKS